MNNSQNITAEMVKSFMIYENYIQRYPHTHSCKIELVDGRTVKKVLYGPEIYLLIQVIAKEKISFKRDPDPEFSTWDPQTIDIFDCHEHDWKHFLRDSYNDHSSLPQKILSSAFQKEGSN